ncbi:MAG: NBR1-Ig-like domain-containing protein [Chloroflexota bacterium]
MPFQKHKLFALLLVLALAASACGNANSNESAVATSVAQTVQARDAQQSTLPPASTPTLTLPAPANTPISTPNLAPKPTFPPTSGKDLNCAQASLVEETIPDGTIMKPGQQFTKIWRIQNTSNCVWDTSYKIVFWDGDVMGGGYVYNFPQQALPGDIVDVPLVLTAPTTDGNYVSSWKLQTPGGTTFGVGYDSPFWVDITVNSSSKVEYGVLSVTYEIVRKPETGCPANVFYTIYATITVNGPVNVTYNWRKSDGTTEDKRTLKFTEAGSKTVAMEWSLHIGSTNNERWVQIFTIAPVEKDYGKASFLYDCQ